MKKILLITDSEKFGGAEKYIQSLTDTMGDKEKYEIIGNKELSKKFYKHNFHEGIISNKKPIGSIISFFKYYLRYSPDIIHLNLTHPASCFWIQFLSLVLYKKIFIATLHLAANFHYPLIVRHLLKITYNKVVIICVANSAKDELWKNYRIKLNNFDIISNWSNYSHFRIPTDDEKRKSKLELRQPINKKILLFIGRFEEQKNILVFLDIARKFKEYNWTMVMVGEGSMKNEIQIKIKEYNLEKDVLVYPFTSDPRKYYWSADAFLLLSKYECTPLSLLEAMGCGLPPVVTDAGDMKYMVGGSEYVWDEKDMHSLEITLSHSLEKTPEQWRTQVLTYFSEDNAKTKIENIYSARY
ncbi:glycosyltransferase [Sporolactobacillus inulinus]|uniref:glycosyltransferase n=1 Tax=Sporolactobacillus inulinus TaxID=2078 RepID=UPI000255C4A8|nr:glycosyltransferase [Sporolactobacillus inulinus]GEB77848.1 glycosyl transferase family 1 [Sporolactobacillus inulinus]